MTSGRSSRITAASARPSAVRSATWSRLMSTPSLLPRVPAARPSGLAVGTTSTVVRSRKRLVSRSSAYARSRTVVRQASRPEGSFPCWLHTRKTLFGVRSAPMRTSWSGRFPAVVPMRVTRTRSLARSTVCRRRCSSGWVVQRAPWLRSKPVRGGAAVSCAPAAGAVTRVAARPVRAAAVRSAARRLIRCPRDSVGGGGRADAVRCGVRRRDGRPGGSAGERGGAAEERDPGGGAGQVDGERRGVGRRVDQTAVGAGDDQCEPVAAGDDVVGGGQVDGEGVAPAGDEWFAPAGAGVFTEVGPAAADDGVADVGGHRAGLPVAGAVALGARSPAGALGQGDDAFPGAGVVADRVGAEVDQDGGEVGRRGAGGDGDGDPGGAYQAQVAGERAGDEARLLRGRGVDPGGPVGLAERGVVGEGRGAPVRAQAERADAVLGAAGGAQGDHAGVARGPGGGGDPLVGGALDVGDGLTVDAVVDALEFVVEPAGQGTHPLRAAEVEGVDVAGLRQPDLAPYAAPAEGVPPGADVPHSDVEVLHAVHQEDAGADLLRAADVVAFGPQRGAVAGARGAVDELAGDVRAVLASLGGLDVVTSRSGPES